MTGAAGAGARDASSAGVEPSPEPTPDPVGGQIDGVAQVLLGALGSHAAAVLEDHLDPAPLVDAAAGAVQIGELDVDAADLFGEATEGGVEAVLHEVLQRLG